MSVLSQSVMPLSNSGNGENGLQQSISYQHYIVSESLLSGIREDGKMSLIRSFFCLFVTFNLLFTILLWFISVVVHGGDIYQSLSNEVYSYSVYTSLFDIVICATLRFTVLLLIYGLLDISRLFVIFVTTSGTSAFLLGKVFFYNWPSSNQPLLQAIIIMSSFIVAWIELWCMGLRVLPQEQYAKKYSTINPGTTEQTPLLSSQTLVEVLSRQISADTLSSQSSAVASDNCSQLFYSPIVTPEGSQSCCQLKYRKTSQTQSNVD